MNITDLLRKLLGKTIYQIVFENMQNCELCGFKNPKATVTAIIIKENRLLMLKREEEPFKGQWDLPGGYMQEEESPQLAIMRELNEELGITDFKSITPIGQFYGNGYWKEAKFPILSHVFLVDFSGNIELNEENSEITWYPLKDLKSEEVAFDSNISIAQKAKELFTFDIERVKELISQLDPNAQVNEQSLYQAVLNGYVSRKYDEEGKLVGMGWIFARQTTLRHQAVIEDMIVDESQRGKGLGKEILQDLADWAKNKGVEVIELTTNPKRIAAHLLYESFGFRIHPTDHMLMDL